MASGSNSASSVSFSGSAGGRENCRKHTDRESRVNGTANAYFSN